MDPLQKFFFNVFCINFCDSNKWLLLLHVTISAVTFLFVHLNRDDTFNVPFSIRDATSVAVRLWFYFYICVYVQVFVEGYLKDRQFNREYNSVIKSICTRHYKTKKDFYAYSIYTLFLLDLLYLILSYCADLSYQNLHNACLIFKITLRFRLWSYLHLARSVLLEFEVILIAKVQRIPDNATANDFLEVQHEYSKLWTISQFIGDYYVFSLCSILFYVFFDSIVYFSWFFTVDFADHRYFLCEYCKFQQELLKTLDIRKTRECTECTVSL